MGSGRTNTTESYGRFRSSVTPEILRKLYESKTDSEIASLYGVSDAIVSRYRREWGIATVTPRERRDRERREKGLPTIDDLTPVDLAALYQRMGDAQIAKMHGVSKPVISRLRREWGIATLTKTDRATSGVILSDEQREVILGSLLGDGHVTGKGAFKVTHSHSQAGYVRRLAALLAHLSKPVRFDEKVMGSGTLAYQFTLWTAPHAWLRQVRRVFYPEGVKVFPEEVVKRLSPRTLAYWYFDDGHLDSNLPSISLGDIPLRMAEDVSKWVGARFGLDTYIRPQSTDTCKILGIRAGTADIFFTLISAFLFPEMLHKVPVKFRPSGVKPVRPRLNMEKRFVLPKDLQDRSKSWESLEERERDHLLTDLVDFWSMKGFPYPSPRVEDLDVLRRLEFKQVVKDGDRLSRISVGQSICTAMQPHLWRTKAVGSAQSPLDTFEDPVTLRKMLRMLLSMGSIPNAHRVRAGVRLFRYGGAYNFRPAAAKALVDRYCPAGGTVFDPCSGWGGRLLGTLLSPAGATYVACEPQPETYEGLMNLHSWAARYLPDMVGRAKVHPVPAEDFDFPQGVDVVMTSPPYWKKMTYGLQPNLAGNRYSTYEAWLDGFWRPVIDKAVRALRVGGWLILNVDDVVIKGQRCSLVEDTKRAVRGLGLGDPVDTYRYEMGRPGNRDNHEPVMCWSKGPRSSPVASGGSVYMVTSKCTGCGRVVPSGVDVCQKCREASDRTTTCEECGSEFEALRKTARFCSGACGARNRRRRKRDASPPSGVRVFTCRGCGCRWETTALGNFRWCPKCKEARDLEGRTKTCGYRECGESFLDTSPRNSMAYCCPEHRRREKQLRSGAVSDASRFRKPDPRG